MLLIVNSITLHQTLNRLREEIRLQNITTISTEKTDEVDMVNVFFCGDFIVENKLLIQYIMSKASLLV